ncbi:hypothetical protein [Oleiagrimonas sp. C23AA]|uniref:hypothetical protein n=1 Tax=Oleiagrimonas sp. C23AA TaxID=2719047 RepID=UPI00141FBC2C|nr:hypothetical protein [Oleiagrimonas sp. C23AA]NII10109.1 hypothetical protein [Oleiagrimonas sp. C23AA]
MIRVSRLFTRLGVVALIGAALVLAGCGTGSIKSDQVSTASLKGDFHTVVKAYKSGQFELDGAVLSPLDLGSHFAYLKDQGQLPKRILLEKSDESKIRKEHLQFMARMAIDYGFSVYYDQKGELRRIDPIEKNARALKDWHPTKKGDNDPMRGKDASHNGYSPELPENGGGAGGGY